MEDQTAETNKPKQDDTDAEFAAMRAIYAALKDLAPDAQERVLDYVFKRLGLAKGQSIETVHDEGSFPLERNRPEQQKPSDVMSGGPEVSADDSRELEGVSAVAIKWMKRNDLSFEKLSTLFSLGVDEIDLVAPKISGKKVKEKMRNVILLQGLAGLLSTGTARVSDQKLREACTHYGAYDGTNFATYLRDFAADVSGNRDAGYSLTTKGLVAAANLVKEMVAPKATK